MEDKKQAALITGAGSGIGAATAHYLAKNGYEVVLLDINADKAKEVAHEINGLAFGCDVSNAEQVEQIFQNILQQQINIRVCVNCAGIAPGKLVVAKDNSPMPLADFERVIQVNLLGTFNVTRLVAAHMSKLSPITASGSRGVIINTASVAAFEGQIGQSAYAASKGGVAAMTLPLARELARFGIRVMCIAPGIMDTPMVHAMPESIQESLASSIPFPKRLGDPTEYAKLALHIIENEMLNGEVIRLDGALRMGPK